MLLMSAPCEQQHKKYWKLPVNIDLHELAGESSQALACICCLAQGMVVLPLLLVDFHL